MDVPEVLESDDELECDLAGRSDAQSTAARMSCSSARTSGSWNLLVVVFRQMG